MNFHRTKNFAWKPTSYNSMDEESFNLLKRDKFFLSLSVVRTTEIILVIGQKFSEANRDEEQKSNLKGRAWPGWWIVNKKIQAFKFINWIWVVEIRLIWAFLYDLISVINYFWTPCTLFKFAFLWNKDWT